MEYIIHQIDDRLRGLVGDLVTKKWGSPKIVSRGNIHNVDQLPGILMLKGNDIVGLLTYYMKGNQCEIVSLDSLEENRGIGSQLLKELEKIANREKCDRIWLITTNDNSHAIRFYQKRNYNLCALHLNTVEKARKLKPEIPLLGNDGIPIKHELEFEKLLMVEEVVRDFKRF